MTISFGQEQLAAISAATASGNRSPRDAAWEAASVSSPTFNSLCRLEERGLLNGPIVGVAVSSNVTRLARTCRFGTDLVGSVLKRDCRAHVVDSSFFPSIGVVNPALSAMANTMRIGYHLPERTGAQPQPEPAHA
jgi:choline dehydrogenase-like flavoprotein